MTWELSCPDPCGALHEFASADYADTCRQVFTAIDNISMDLGAAVSGWLVMLSEQMYETAESYAPILETITTDVCVGVRGVTSAIPTGVTLPDAMTDTRIATSGGEGRDEEECASEACRPKFLGFSNARHS